MGYEKLTGGKAKVGGLSINGADLTASAADLNTLLGAGAAAQRRVKTVIVALSGAADTGGGIGAWANPEAANILIQRVLVDVTTVATAACLVDVGTTATSATTLSDNLLDGIDVHTATGQHDNLLAADAGTNGKTVQKLAAGKWVTFSTQAAGGASAGLVGNAYIEYVLA